MAVAAASGRADGDEHRLRPGNRGCNVVAERQAPGGDVVRHQAVEPRLVNGDPARLQQRQLGRVHFNDGDVHPKVGKARARNEAHIAATDHRDTHRGLLSNRAAPAGEAVISWAALITSAPRRPALTL